MSIPTSVLGITDFALRSALYYKFTSFLNNLNMDSSIILFPFEVAQREFSEKQGRSTVDFISCFRNVTQFSWGRNQTAASRIGVPLNYVDSSMQTVVTAKAIPLDLEYEIIFWHHNYDTLNMIIETYFFWIQNTPEITIEFQGYDLIFYLHIKGSQDISTTRNMYQVGNYWVYRCSINIDSWIPQISTAGSVINQIIANIWYLEQPMSSSIKLETITIPPGKG